MRRNAFILIRFVEVNRAKQAFKPFIKFMCLFLLSLVRNRSTFDWPVPNRTKNVTHLTWGFVTVFKLQSLTE